jgi:imidazolonepropionase-like amidohydrolase
MDMATLRNVHLVGLDAPVGPELVDVVFQDTITQIRAADPSVSATEEEIDGDGGFLLPGLIDTHVHLGSPAALIAAARAGLTTVVDLGTHPDSVIDAQRDGRGTPAILSAGSAASALGSTQIARMGFPAESGVTDPADAARYLAWRTEHGADLIKIIIEDPAATEVPALDVPTLAALVAGAHERGLVTVAHAVTAAAFGRGLDAGVDILTHAPLDRLLPDGTAQRMREQGTVVSPTLVMMRAMAQARLGDRADLAFRNSVESVRALHAAGVTIIAGTDANETPMAPVPHGPSLHDEIEHLKEAGLSTTEALRAATSAAADVLRLVDRGRIAEGLRADLVLVKTDPTRDPGVLRNPVGVWIAGVPVS